MKYDSNGATPTRVQNGSAVAKALGSDAPVRLRDDLTTDVAQLLTLAHRLQVRLRSSGGRPTDPSWTTSRRVPFSDDVWQTVQATARRLSQVTGYKVSPAQLCGQIIEDRLGDLDQAVLRAFEERTHPPDEE
jgi:hypothetical protein